MISILLAHFAVLVPATLTLWFADSPLSGMSFAVGSLLALGNFLVLYWFMSRIFAKKQVALSSLVIVFKYLILGIIIYFVITRANLDLIWFGAGLISVLFTVTVNFRRLELGLQTDEKLPVEERG